MKERKKFEDGGRMVGIYTDKSPEKPEKVTKTRFRCHKNIGAELKNRDADEEFKEAVNLKM